MSGDRTSFARTHRTTLQHADNATYDRATVYSILDATLAGFVTTTVEGEPILRPMSHIRIHDDLYLHGHRTNRMLTHLATGAPLCFGVASIDGIVFGRRIDTHTINFRSAMVHGRAEPVTDRSSRLHVLRTAFERLAPGRWDLLPPLTPGYVDEMAILRIPLVECVAKVRAGMPGDWDAAPDPRVWAGVVPLALTRGTPEGDA